MCDTLLLRSRNATWLAKNSDRDPLEAQRVEVHPAVQNDRSKTLRCTWIEIPQVPRRHAIIIGRPAWMWGAEMGVNECGVAIGNEAIFSRCVQKQGAALLGMDLVRLALERADSAEAALQVIVELLEQYGQGGPAGYTQHDFRYDNSFMIADADGAWKLETAGKHWRAQRVSALDSISNGLSIERDAERSSAGTASNSVNFRQRYDTWLLPMFARSRERRAASLAALQALDSARSDFADFAAILRSHRKEKPSGNSDLCMHAAGQHSPLKFLRPSHTVNAMIVRIDSSGPRVAFTGTSSSCISLFRPVDFSGLWHVCQRDLWEQHRVWADHFWHNPGDRNQLRQQINTAEQDIFACIGNGDLAAAEQLSRHWSNQIFSSPFVHTNVQSLQETS